MEDAQGWLSAMLHRQTTREGSRAQDATWGDGGGFVHELASAWKSGRPGRVRNLDRRPTNMRPRRSHYDGAGERVPQAVQYGVGQMLSELPLQRSRTADLPERLRQGSG